ncbi:MAG: FlgD immunoglobulin-like domain containing protein [bacterium]|nr:FlgD immunoglobulin-like domain containing protein [bacterium]
MRGITRFSSAGVLCLACLLFPAAETAAQSGTIDFNSSQWSSLVGQVLYRGGPANTLTDAANGVDFIVTYGAMNITAAYPTGYMLFFSPIIPSHGNDQAGQVQIRFSTAKRRVSLRVSHDEHPVHTPYYTTVKFYRDFNASNALATVDVEWNSGRFTTAEHSDQADGIRMVVVTTMFAENNIDDVEFEQLDSSEPPLQQAFTFDDGTAQGWTLTGAFNEAGQGPAASNFTFGWHDAVQHPGPSGQDPAGDGRGCVRMNTAGGHGITDPGHTWFIMQFHSPDLSTSAVWQAANGYAVRIADCMTGTGTLYANAYVTVYDPDQARDRTFYSGDATPLRRDAYGDGTAVWNTVLFDWSVLSSFPARRTVREVFINIWGRLSDTQTGSLFLDAVSVIPGENVPQPPAAPSNVQAVQLPGQIHVTWLDHSDDENGFRLEMKEFPTFPGDWQEIAVLGPDVTSHQITGVRFNHSYYFRVRSFNDNGVSAYSNTDTLYCGYQLSYIRILRPNGGETWNAESVQAINWESSTMLRPERVNIHYSSDGGSHWVFPPIASGIQNLGTFSWTVPADLSADCVVKVENADGLFPYDLSDAPFRILEGSGPVLSLSADTLDFGADLQTLSFSIVNTGTGELSWSVTPDAGQPWVVSVNPVSGTGNAEITVGVDRTLLAADEAFGGLNVGSSGGDERVVLAIRKPDPGPPPEWDFTPNTGNNATVILPAAAGPNIDGTPLAAGDWIGVFTDAGLCCGRAQWAGANLSVTAWGDDSQTTAKDGFSAGETVHYRVYRTSTATEWRSVTAGYSLGSGLYTADGLMILNRFDVSGLGSLTVGLRQGWNLFSINVTPGAAGMDQVMAPVAGDLVIVKNGQGKTCIPEFQINDIGDIDVRQGYKAYLNRAADLTVQGIPVDRTTTLELQPGWNMIGYWPDAPMPIVEALAGILDFLVIAKDGSGNTYLPQYGINTIGSMAPGQGYQVYPSAAATLEYPSGPEPRVARSAAQSRSAAELRHFRFVSNTGENATVVVPAEAHPGYSDGTRLAVGDEIGVFTSDGRCCGAVVWEDVNAAITVWGDDALTDSVDGFLDGDTLRLAVWKTGTDGEIPAATLFREGDPVVFATDGFSVVTSLVADLTAGLPGAGLSGPPEGFGLSVNYPNPFNSETVISYRMPVPGRVDLTVFDLSGRPVRSLRKGPQQAGSHTAAWDGRDGYGVEVPSGLYTCRIRVSGNTGGFTAFQAVRKMTLIR